MSIASPSRPLVSVIIPVFNKWELTRVCLQRLQENTADVDHEVIVIDNASTDGTTEGMAAWPKVRYQRNPENLGFARAINQGARLARGRYLMLLNNDTEPQRGWLAAMVAVAEADHRVAIVGCKLLFPDGTIQHGGVVFAYATPEPVTPFHFDYRKPANTRNRTLELRAVTAACMLIRPEVFAAMGGLDEAFVNGYEDVDLCLKVWSSSGKIIYTPDAVVIHHESVSEGRFRHAVQNVDRLNDLWMDRFFSFEVDFRRAARPAAVDPARPGASVIVVSEQSLMTIAPCLENIVYAVGAQDQVIVVDNASTGASRRFPESFAARHRDRVSVVRCDERLGVSAAVRMGLQQATRPYAALVDQNVKVVAGWLDRLIGHLQANSGLGAVTPSFRSNTALSDSELFAPPEIPDVARWQPPVAPRGQVSQARGAASAIVVAETEVLRGTLADPAADLFGRDPGAFAAALASRNRQLGRAPDVVSYKLDETKGVNDPLVMERVIDCQSAALRTEAPRITQVTLSLRDNFPKALADALSRAPDDLVAVVGDGVVPTPDWLPLLRARLDADPDVAAVGPISNEAARTPQHLAGVGYQNLQQLPAFAARWTRLHRGEYSFVPRLLPFCLVLRRRHVDDVGGVDTSYLSAAGAIEDLCLRLAAAGRRLAAAHDVFVHSSSPFETAPPPEDVHRLREFHQVFNRQARPWDSDVTKRHRLLLIPDWQSPAWRQSVVAYLRAFSAADPVALIVRVEPPAPERTQAAWTAVSALFTELEMSPDQSADIVFEATQLPAAQRGGLYTSATAYLRGAPSDQPALVREAAACGLPVLTAPDAAQLRQWLARQTAG